MAKQTGLFNFEGTLDNVTFYKTADGHFVRKKGGVSKQRIMKDSSFVRTRENCAEFSGCAKSASALRKAASVLVFKAKDNKLSSRLISLFFTIKKLDSVNVRGSRSVAQGLTEAGGKTLLKGFDFNRNAQLHTVVGVPYTLDVLTGSVTINNLQPTQTINFPEGATHFSLQSAFLALDFFTGVSELCLSNLENYPLTNEIVSSLLVPNGVPAVAGTKIHLLLCEFFQEVNGIQYSLHNGLFNVLTILEVH